jgi:hypothetical protein
MSVSINCNNPPIGHPQLTIQGTALSVLTHVPPDSGKFA